MCLPGMTTHVPTLGFEEIEEDLRAWDAARERRRRAAAARSVSLSRATASSAHFRPAAAQESPQDDRRARRGRVRGAFRRVGGARNDRAARSDRAGADRRAGHLDEVEPEGRFLARFVTAAMSARRARAGSARGRRAGCEAGRRAQQRRRGRRGSGAHAQRDQAGRLGALRRRTGVSRDGPKSSRSRSHQGAKPGEGGQIPGFKVSAEIAVIARRGPPVRPSYLHRRTMTSTRSRIWRS